MHKQIGIAADRGRTVGIGSKSEMSFVVPAVEGLGHGAHAEPVDGVFLFPPFCLCNDGTYIRTAFHPDRLSTSGGIKSPVKS